MIKLAKLRDGPEIFLSIQGEGKSSGRPSIFVRLSLCNLHCFWCDTDYTWNWENTGYAHANDASDGYAKYKQDDNVILLSGADLMGRIASIDCDNVVITGGEPLLQRKELVPLLAGLKQSRPGYHFEFETNGTLLPGADLDFLSDQYNVSVKLSNSRIEYKRRINEEAIGFFANSSKANFKFVMDAEEDVREVLELQEAFHIASGRIYLMPQGKNPETLKSKEKWLMEICAANDFNYTDRLHIRIFGDKRGV
jgi:7-carboxy-7-deazaguanine synthase